MTRRRTAAVALAAAAVLGVLTACGSSPAPRASRSPSSSTAVAPAPSGRAEVPAFDHVVVVVMENHAFDEIIGNPDAPFINGLAARGALLTQSYATNHSSEPNYLALFSGSAQHVSGDPCPLSFTAPNLASTLLAEGRTFVGYSEDLPATGSTVCTSGAYARKHNPWSNFPAVPGSLNRPLTAFPGDYSQLPTVSFVIPNLQHDMHDGSIAEGDAWLRAHLGGYADWAGAHRSLLVLTFDEDDRSAGNHIPTLLSGAFVRAGRYDSRVDHFRVLRTIADAACVPAPGEAAHVAPMLRVWTP